MYTVEYTVKGALNIRTKTCATLTDAARFAARWRRSNSTGEYVAWVTDPNGKQLAV